MLDFLSYIYSNVVFFYNILKDRLENMELFIQLMYNTTELRDVNDYSQK